MVILHGHRGRRLFSLSYKTLRIVFFHHKCLKAPAIKCLLKKGVLASRQGIHDFLKRYATIGSTCRKHGSGRRSKVSHGSHQSNRLTADERRRRDISTSAPLSPSFQGTLSIRYFSLFCLWELLPASDRPCGSLLSWGAVTFNHSSDPTLLKIHLRFAKCDQFGQGNVLIGRTGNAIYPVAACLDYMSVRGVLPGPHFRMHDGKPLLKRRVQERTRLFVVLSFFFIASSLANHLLSNNRFRSIRK